MIGLIDVPEVSWPVLRLALGVICGAPLLAGAVFLFLRRRRRRRRPPDEEA